jgi:predicted small metal-binding protein
MSAANEDVVWTLACGDVVPGCPTVFTAATQDQVIAQVAPHAAGSHGLDEIDLETRQAVVAAMVQRPRPA